MEKIKPTDRVSIPIRLSKNTHAELMLQAENRMVAASVIVERALVRFFEKLPTVEESLGEFGS